MNALDLITTTQWAMLREPLETMLQIARDRAADRLAGLLEAREPGRVETPEWCTWAERTREYEAILLHGGGKLEGSRRALLRDGVAVVPVLGPIFRRANLMTELSGATSLELVARDLSVAMASESVKSILLEIDSPGGEVSGVAELAGHLMAMNRKKPVCAYVGGSGASAAYWLAAACGGITASSTALLGSIGVLAAYRKDRGEEVTIVSSQSPRKKSSLETDEGRQEAQRVVDELAAVFVGDVARYRAVSEATVLNDFGQGGVMVGRRAVQAGLADRIGTLESTLRALAENPQAMTDRRRRAESDADLAASAGTESLEGEAPAAGPFEREISTLLADVERSKARAREIHACRRAEGRSLSPQRREQLAAVRDGLTELLRLTEPRASAAERIRLAMQASAMQAARLRQEVGALLGDTSHG